MSDAAEKLQNLPLDPLSMYDDLLIPVVAIDAGQNIVYFNQQSSGFLKLPPRKLRNKPLFPTVNCPVFESGDLIESTFREWVPKVSEETSIQIEGGEVRDVIIKAIPLAGSETPIVVVTMLDNSIERILHEKHRKQLEELKLKNAEIKKYSEGLEILVDERTKELRVAREESEKLLLNILPAKIAERLKRSNDIIADRIDSCSVMFVDIVNFTKISGPMDPVEVVQFLSQVFDRFDRLVAEFGLEKIKTIGDAYLVVAGVPEPIDDHAAKMCQLALKMVEALEELNRTLDIPMQARFGINSGPVVAGVLGLSKLAFDIWGDAVNVASRMESHGIPGKIQISANTFELIEGQFDCEERGIVTVKGKGDMQAYWLGKCKS